MHHNAVLTDIKPKDKAQSLRRPESGKRAAGCEGPCSGRMAGLTRSRSRQNQFLEDVRTARRAEGVAVCSLFIVLLWGACLIPLPTTREHEHGANDSLLYHSLLGRAMGNTLRMRPRDRNGKTYDLSTEHSTVETVKSKAAAVVVGGPHNREVPGLTDTRDIADAWLLENPPTREAGGFEPPPSTLEKPPPSEGVISARITVRAASKGSDSTGGSKVAGQEPPTLQLRSQAGGAQAASEDERGGQVQQLTQQQQQQMLARMLEDGEELVDNPGDANLAANAKAGNGFSGKVAMDAASTLQAKAKAATQGENLVDAEMDRLRGADSMQASSEQRLAKAKLAAGIGETIPQVAPISCASTS